MRILIAAMLAATARASSAGGGAVVDWAKGLVTAEGIGVADRHAPNPSVARGTSRRVAEDAARAQIAATFATLPVAAGGTVGAKLGDPAVKTRVDRALANTVVVAAEPETDGAWRVTLGLPIEAIRQAIAGGPRPLAASGDAGPPIVIVDGVTAKPAIGWTVGGTAAATVWVNDVPEWANTAPHVKATRAAAGAIELAGTAGGPATLYVIAGTK